MNKFLNLIIRFKDLHFIIIILVYTQTTISGCGEIGRRARFRS